MRSDTSDNLYGISVLYGRGQKICPLRWKSPPRFSMTGSLTASSVPRATTPAPVSALRPARIRNNLVGWSSGFNMPAGCCLQPCGRVTIKRNRAEMMRSTSDSTCSSAGRSSGKLQRYILGEGWRISGRLIVLVALGRERCSGGTNKRALASVASRVSHESIGPRWARIQSYRLFLSIGNYFKPLVLK